MEQNQSSSVLAEGAQPRLSTLTSRSLKAQICSLMLESSVMLRSSICSMSCRLTTSPNLLRMLLLKPWVKLLLKSVSTCKWVQLQLSDGRPRDVLERLDGQPVSLYDQRNIEAQAFRNCSLIANITTAQLEKSRSATAHMPRHG